MTHPIQKHRTHHSLNPPRTTQEDWLVVEFSAQLEKYEAVKMGENGFIFPKDRGENKNKMEATNPNVHTLDRDGPVIIR